MEKSNEQTHPSAVSQCCPSAVITMIQIDRLELKQVLNKLDIIQLNRNQ